MAFYMPAIGSDIFYLKILWNILKNTQKIKLFGIYNIITNI